MAYCNLLLKFSHESIITRFCDQSGSQIMERFLIKTPKNTSIILGDETLDISGTDESVVISQSMAHELKRRLFAASEKNSLKRKAEESVPSSSKKSSSVKAPSGPITASVKKAHLSSIVKQISAAVKDKKFTDLYGGESFKVCF
jgi:hypothetical protein